MSVAILLLVALGAILIAAFLALFLSFLNRNGGDRQLQPILSDLKEALGSLDKSLKDEVSRDRVERERQSTGLRQEIFGQIQVMAQTTESRLEAIRGSNDKQGDQLRQTLEQVRSTIEQRLQTIRVENEAKLEQMRQTVDEKLQATLETRLGESFRTVSDHLERVQRGLGEMQTLAAGVGDLKRVLSNVKARGTWGEVQLGALLEQVLTREQYELNVAVTNGSERVEFAIRLPGADDSQAQVWLPIDSKFPMEDYQRLVDACDRADNEGMSSALGQLERSLRGSAKVFSEKYLSPPMTTDFGILFLPTEGLYAEALRIPGLADICQREHRTMFAGPTTLAALLNSLRVGFRTLEIQKKSSDVWLTLGAVKSEFGKYAAVLNRVKTKLDQASSSIDDVAVRTRAIQRQLRNVETPGDALTRLIDVNAPDERQDTLFIDEQRSPSRRED